MSDLYYGWKKSNTESSTLFSIKDQSKDARVTTQTHGYHKPYAADWGEARMKAKAKRWLSVSIQPVRMQSDMGE